MLGASHAATRTHDSVDSIIGVCNKFFVNMNWQNQGVFGNSSSTKANRVEMLRRCNKMYQKV